MTDSVFVAFAVILRIVSNPFGNVFQKQLTKKGIHPLIVNFFTYFYLLFACLLIVIFARRPLLNVQFWIYSVLGGMAGALGNGFIVKAMQKGEISILGPVNSYKSVIGILGGILLLGEIPNLRGIIGIVLIIFGSYFVLDTTAERFTMALLRRSEIQFRLWAMVLTAIEAVFIKKVIIASSTSFAFISWCFFGAFFSFILLLIYKPKIKEETGLTGFWHIGKLSVLALCTGTMQYTTNYALEHMPVGYALSFFQLSVLVSVLLGYRFFKEQDLGKKLLGSAIMVIGSVIIILSKSG